MNKAKNYFCSREYKVEDVSAQNPYDLLCTKHGEELHVEVKGTTNFGSTILLTRNEVEPICNESNRCALFIVHSIKIEADIPYSGECRIISPWKIEKQYLKPVNYLYEVSGTEDI